MPDFNQDVQDNSAEGVRLTELLNQYLAQKKPLSSHEQERNRRLGASVGAGLTGLSYLTGHRKPEVETYYDKHPAQAVARDFANQAPGVGLGVAAGGTLANFAKDIMRNKKMEGIEHDLREGGGEEGAAKGGFIDPREVGKDGKPKTPSDFQNVFGRSENELGDLEHDFKGLPGGNSEDAARGKVNAYSRFYSVLRKMPRSGSVIPPHLGPGSDEEIARMVETNLPRMMGGSSEGLNHDLIKKMVMEHLGGNEERANNVHDKIWNRHENNEVKQIAGRSFGGGKGGRMNEFMHGAANKVTSWLPKKLQDHRVSPAMQRNFSRAKTPALIGGGLALGGMAMAPILKAIHHKTYGDDQIKQWTNATRQVKGKFDELE